MSRPSGKSALARTLLVALLLLGPGCVLTSAANRLSDATVPEQGATVAAIETSSVRVVIRANDGSEAERTASFSGIGPVVTATVARAWHRTQGVNPVAIFEDGPGRESLFVVTAQDAAGKSQGVDVESLSVAPSTGARAASYGLMPFGFLVDVATFPLEWLGIAVVLWVR